ncbi:glyoxalase [Paenibacillus sp. FSL R7-0273]|uniref:VOC family protein n=1 Tax=Paenibacillus sp. FSL R7-0273 TaxID=1536772 RepID=UPI0004F65F43|nr:VOC family protein [Paenibacillus sp. FSL R7-0273]AIQ48397.1 glyoxalase [Paenibacillus sp. FSL R7-0273]OMF88455.1 glyoxalase [Paenibacillus sp. FSL R7-0273]
MIKQIGQIMLYVNDQDQALRFWTEKVGFVKVSEADNGQGLRWIEIAPAAGLQTSFVLHNKQLIAEMQPELNLGTPSILLYADDLDTLYKDFQAKGITVGELVDMPEGRVFNFADDENNYFAIVQK